MSYSEKAERLRVQIQGLLVELNEINDSDEAFFKFGGTKYRIEDDEIMSSDSWSQSRCW